jgi:hypothetical protein
MCQLCNREIVTTKHHLIPRSRKRREREAFGPTANLCADCHRKCHATWDNATLARDYNTIQKIKVAPELQSYIKWIRKQAPTVYFGSKERVND